MKKKYYLSKLTTIFFCILTVFQFSCKKDQIQIASSIDILSGAGQTAKIETTLENPVIIVVKDQNGKTLQGVTVNFSVTEGIVSASSLTTDNEGRGSVEWTLGLSGGNQSLSITATDNAGKALSGSPVLVNAIADPIAIGGYYSDGIIFYLDDTEEHGLVCSINDQATSITWNNTNFITTGATAEEIGTGSANTSTIISFQGDGTYAAKVCNDYTVSVGDEWFLPSRNELNEIYSNKDKINTSAILNGGSSFVPDGYYWSSTETGETTALYQSFSNGDQTAHRSKGGTLNVRAIKAF